MLPIVDESDLFSPCFPLSLSLYIACVHLHMTYTQKRWLFALNGTDIDRHSPKYYNSWKTVCALCKNWMQKEMTKKRHLWFHEVLRNDLNEVIYWTMMDISHHEWKRNLKAPWPDQCIFALCIYNNYPNIILFSTAMSITIYTMITPIPSFVGSCMVFVYMKRLRL